MARSLCEWVRGVSRTGNFWYEFVLALGKLCVLEVLAANGSLSLLPKSRRISRVYSEKAGENLTATGDFVAFDYNAFGSDTVGEFRTDSDNTEKWNYC